MRGAPAYLTPDMVDTLSNLNAFSVSSGDLLPLMKPVKTYAQFLRSNAQHTDDTSSSDSSAPIPLGDAEASKVEASPYHTMLQLNSHVLALTLRNPFVEHIAQNTGNELTVVSDRGNTKIPPEMFCEIADVFRPDIVVLPSEDSPYQASSSKIDKVIRRNMAWGSAILNTINTNLPKSRQPFVFAPVEGGHVIAKRREHVERLQSQTRMPDGYVIGGFHLADSTPESRSQAIGDTLSLIPENAARAVYTTGGDPVEVVEAVSKGVDVLLSVTYPVLAAEQGFAFNFPITLEELEAAVIEMKNEESKSATEASSENEMKATSSSSLGDTLTAEEAQSMSADNMTANEPKTALEIAKKRNAAAVQAMTREMAQAEDKPNLFINVRRVVYREDPNPLLPKCGCYSCTHHTRSYVNHLLNANEMLADNLLLLHNLHHYGRLFEYMRTLLEDGQSQEMKTARWQKWYELFMRVVPSHKLKMVNRRVRVFAQGDD